MQPAIKSRTLVNELLGQALVKRGVITQAQLDMALEIQKYRKDRYLGEILQYFGVSQGKINETLDYLNKRKKIGEILIDLGLISSEDLKRALKEQKMIQSLIGVKRPLGTLLFQMGLIKHEDYMWALSKHFVLQIVSLENRRIHPSLQEVLGKKYVCEHHVLVLENDGIIIKIALGEPTFSLMQEIKKSIPPHLEIIFYLAHLLEIESVQKKIFAPYSLHNYR
jgi:predicted transcriptional regulator with HTH domain